MARYMLDPFEELKRIQDRISQMFEEMPEAAGPSKEGSTQMPYMDVVDRDNDIVVTADMPGVDKKDIKINIRGDMLDISAERKAEQEKKEKGYVRHERSYSRYYRAIRLPAAVDKNKAKANFNNGVLEITLPKTEKTEMSSVPVS